MTMNSEDRAWVEMLRETKTSGNIGFGGRQMRRLLGIVDALEAEADELAKRLADSSAPCPENRFCVGPVRLGCEREASVYEMLPGRSRAREKP